MGRTKTKKKTANFDGLIEKLDTSNVQIYSKLIELVINKFKGFVDVIKNSGTDKDFVKPVERIYSEILLLIDDCGKKGYLKQIVDAKNKGLIRAKVEGILDEVEKLKYEASHVDGEGKKDAFSKRDYRQFELIDLAEYTDLINIERKSSAEWNEPILNELAFNGISGERLKVMFDLIIEMIRRKRMSMGFASLFYDSSTMSSENEILNQAISSLYFLELGMSKFIKSDSTWKHKLLSSSSLKDLVSCLKELYNRTDKIKLSQNWKLVHDEWIHSLDVISNLNSLFPFLLSLACFFLVDYCNNFWTSFKDTWENVCVKLSLNDTNGSRWLYINQFLVLEVHLNISESWKNSERHRWLSSLMADDEVKSHCANLLDFANRLHQEPELFSYSWKSVYTAWSSKVKYSESYEILAKNLLRLEENICSDRLHYDWRSIRRSWVKTLSLYSWKDFDLHRIKELVIEFESGVSSLAFQENFRGKDIREGFRRNLHASLNPLDIAKQLIELESRLTKESLGVNWIKDYSFFWREGVLNSFTSSEIASWILEFQSSTTIPMSKVWLESEKTMGARLKSLIVSNTKGRFTSVKNFIMLLEINCNSAWSLNESWPSLRTQFLTDVLRAKNATELATLMLFFLNKLNESAIANSKFRLHWFMQGNSLLEIIQPRNFCQVLLQFIEDVDEKFFRPTWRTQRHRVTSSLKLVNKELVKEGIVSILKSFLHLFEKHLKRICLDSSWIEKSESWAAGVFSCTSMRSLGSYLIALSDHLNDQFLNMVWKGSFKVFNGYYCNHEFTVGSFSAYLLILEASLSPDCFHSESWAFARVTWLQTLRDALLDDSEGRLCILKFASLLLIENSSANQNHIKDLAYADSMESFSLMCKEHLHFSDESLMQTNQTFIQSIEKKRQNNPFETEIMNLLYQFVDPIIASCESLKTYTGALFGNLLDNLFLNCKQHDASVTSLLTRVEAFRSLENNIRVISRKVSDMLKSMKLDLAFQEGFDGEVYNSVFNSLENAHSVNDVSTCLKYVDFYLSDKAYILPYDKSWSLVRNGFLYGLKRFEMNELKSIQELQRIVFELDEDEAGHATIGHNVVDERDKLEAQQAGSDLLFGELLVDGVSKCIDRLHMDASRAETLCDLGMGLGKLALQAWFMHKSLRYVLGVELARTRYSVGEQALLRLVELYPSQFKILFHEFIDPKRLRIAIQDQDGRILEFRKQDLFLVKDEGKNGGLCADIVITETHFPEATMIKLCQHLNGMKPGARLLTYENLTNLYGGSKIPMPFRQLSINIPEEDRFPTTWSTVRGHHFFLWEKLK